VSRNLKIVWTVIIVASLLFQVGVALLVAGHDATPYGTLDNEGRPLGFNDPITKGHIKIMLSNATIRGFAEATGWYASVGMLAHIAGIAIVWGSMIRRGIRRCFFGLQTLLFPLAWFPPFWWVVLHMFRGPLDGESFQDGPVSVITTQASWWLVSIVVFFWDLAHEEFTNDDKTVFHPAKL